MASQAAGQTTISDELREKYSWCFTRMSEEQCAKAIQSWERGSQSGPRLASSEHIEAVLSQIESEGRRRFQTMTQIITQIRSDPSLTRLERATKIARGMRDVLEEAGIKNYDIRVKIFDTEVNISTPG